MSANPKIPGLYGWVPHHTVGGVHVDGCQGCAYDAAVADVIARVVELEQRVEGVDRLRRALTRIAQRDVNAKLAHDRAWDYEQIAITALQEFAASDGISTLAPAGEVLAGPEGDGPPEGGSSE